ncbi:MAG: type I-MYXAN CRISPR-associated protein Cas6/Cmx6 [Gammaproteobacteria bacterium]|jgi:CRISPR-associated protein Cas6|nr:type I-MYXAN CRISPR-associated protein Cas6/Cmx6 [Gammaproteobacteria bacterium]
MHWEEQHTTGPVRVREDVVDMVFHMRAESLPVDHALALWQALEPHLPWLADEPGAGVHPIHVAGSGNGWQRPLDPDALLHPSRRTRLVIRVPAERVAETAALVGQSLDVAGNRIVVGEVSSRPLSALTTIFARHVVASSGDEDEEGFIDRVAAELVDRGLHPRKMLCGIAHRVRGPGEALHTRPLMLAELELADSLALQAQGVGRHPELGCGLFIPHKDIREVRSEPRD